ncbi:MAG: CAP domain-containing protein [Chloroflexota bacterium]
MNILQQSPSFAIHTRPAIILTILLSVVLSVTCPMQEVYAQSNTIYLPIIQPTGCEQLSSKETEIVMLVQRHPGQQRESVQCNSTLIQVAREKAMDLGLRNYMAHVDPDGIGPDQLVRNAGYQLPNFYGYDVDSNYIESIAGGRLEAETWDIWMNSPGHRMHLLGEVDFYAEQTEIGIGYAYVENSTYKHYWVFFSAHSEEDEE